MIQSTSCVSNNPASVKLYQFLPQTNAMREIFVALGVVAVACLSLLTMSMRSSDQTAIALQLKQTIASQMAVEPAELEVRPSSTLIADLPPDDDKGAPGNRGERGGNRGRRG